jgi:NAD(P)-dependent dehydrogenase (short-subunit alcohol dehydrogenase family)
MPKNVLITGASGNLGRSTVDTFLRDGYNVIVTVTPGKKSDFPAGKHLTSYEADLTNEKVTEEVVKLIHKQHGTIDTALLLVGGFAMGKIGDTDKDALTKMISLNFDTAYFVARPVFEIMKQQSGGRIVMVGARPALHPSEGKNVLAYALSKSMIFKLAEFLNAEGASCNVVTSVIVPGIIDTPANRKAMPDANFQDWVSPEEIARTISFLCSEEQPSFREPVVKLYGNS